MKLTSLTTLAATTSSLLLVLVVAAVTTSALVPQSASPSSRRAFFSSCATAAAAFPAVASARYVLNEDTGDYDQVEDPKWQDEWKGRMDKAQSMSKDQVFQAARGAGNLDLRQGDESEASKKRRAMSACRDDELRPKAGVASAKECTARVFQGETDFILKAL